MEYDVLADSVVEDDLLAGRFRVSFTKGKHTPKNENEEHALERLVTIGAATRSKPKKES